MLQVNWVPKLPLVSIYLLLKEPRICLKGGPYTNTQPPQDMLMLSIVTPPPGDIIHERSNEWNDETSGTPKVVEPC